MVDQECFFSPLSKWCEYFVGGSYTHNRMYSTSTMGGGSVVDGESTTADYDIATGTGTMMGVGATSTMNRYNTMNTMQSQSNYQVKCQTCFSHSQPVIKNACNFLTTECLKLNFC